MQQIQTGIECGLNVVPEIYHRVELKNASAIDRVEIVVIQEVENDVLAQAGTNQSGEPNDQIIAKMAFDKLFQSADDEGRKHVVLTLQPVCLHQP